MSDERCPKIACDVPQSARVWNYWMGGKDNYPVDRAAGDAVVAVYPDIVRAAREGRKFLYRTVRYLAGEAGIGQFLDIGTGLPTMQNTHEVAQSVRPDARVVYVDNDPLVLAHARALLTNTTAEGVTTYLYADVRDPELIVTDARNVLNFDEPVAVMFLGILGHIADFDEVCRIVERVMQAVPSGSFLVLGDSTDTGAEVNEGADEYAATGTIPYNLRTPEQLSRCFAGLELVDPGLVSVIDWRPDVGGGEPRQPLDYHGAVARKP